MLTKEKAKRAGILCLLLNLSVYVGFVLADGPVFTGTLFNSIVVGAIIFPQTRYMIYNMGLFYTAFFMLFGCLLKERKSRKFNREQ